MKKLLIILPILLLSACSIESETKNIAKTEDQNVIKIKDLSNVGYEKIKDGEKIPENNPAVVSSIECSKEKKPVCGKIKNNLNGYLNKCEAKRHGAEVISEGFCNLEVLKEDERCDAEFLTIGNCEMKIEGFVFNKKSKTCKKVSGSGCESQIPFETQETCEKSCK